MGFLSKAAGGLFKATGLDSLMGGLFPDARQMAAFKPMNTSGPFGTTTFQDGQMNFALSPELQGVQSSLFGAMSGGPFGMTPMQQALAQQGSTLGLSALGLGGMSGEFGRGLGLQAAGAGQGFLGAAQATNPMDIAQGQFDKMQALLSPRRERARLGLESRLLRQGLLGSTAGGEQFRAMGESEAMQDARIAESALREGMQTQQGLFGMGLQGMQAGQGLFGAGTGQQLGAMSQGLGMLGTGANMQQQALGNYLRMLGAQQGLGQGLLSQAGLGMQGGQAQQRVDMFNTQQQAAEDARMSDFLSGLITSGASMAMGLPPIGGVGGLQNTDPNAANFNWGAIT